MRTRPLLIFSVAIVLTVAALRLLPRTETFPTSYGYIERDRWTGSAKACSVNDPEMWLRSQSKDPLRICLDLD